MSRIAIFLRGINLGRRRLAKDELLRPFLEAGFRGAETFIASGNVVVDDPGMARDALEARVEEAVARAFGFRADAFARPLPALARLTEEPVLLAGEGEGFTPHVIFLKEAPTAEAAGALGGLATPDDRFPALGREVLWLRRGNLSDSVVEPRHLERALGGAPSTMRKVTTLRRMVEKFGG
jgi:uncharacterized protein (DUF1697 family)